MATMSREEEKVADDADLIASDEVERLSFRKRYTRSHDTTGTTSITDGDVTQTVGEFDETKEEEEDDDKARKEELLQEAMADQLDVMLAIILKIRANEDFAVSIYANCPRLQHLLDQHPDLRPVFEDPNLIRINFEQVYRKAGGVLPEDKPNYFRLVLKYIVNHPLFKVFRFLLLIKKLYTCVMGSGIAMVKGVYATCFPDPTEVDPKAAAALAEVEEADAMPEESTNEANRQALYSAADYMETPEVQSRMQELLESNPDNLPEVIEQDPELKALRDANPLCAELMNDPETMKILIEPDNLRALGECPDLIAADFANPEWSPPDVEHATFDDSLAPPEPVEGAAIVEEVPVEEPVTLEEVMEEEGEGEEEEEEEEGFMEGFERGEEPEGQGGGAASARKSSIRRQGARDLQGSNRMSAYVTSLGTGLVDYVAGETVGVTMTHITGSGGEDELAELAALEEEAEEVEEMAVEDVPAAIPEEAEAATATTFNSSMANLATSAADVGEYAASDDVAGTLQENMDKIEEAHDKELEESGGSSSGGMSGGAIAATAAGGTAAVGGGTAAAAVARQRRNVRDEPGMDEDERSMDDDEDFQTSKRGSVIGMAGSYMRGSVSVFGSAAASHLASSLLGEDLGANVVEKLQASSDKMEEENEKDGEQRSSSVIGRARRTVRSSIVALGEAVKEHAATTVLGDDLGEDLMDKLEGDEEEEQEDDQRKDAPSSTDAKR